MSRREKKKHHIGFAVWLILLLLVLAMIVLLLVGKVFGLRMFGSGGVLPSVPINDRQKEDFTVTDDRVSYPGARPGIDVSEHQQSIDWEAVRADGIEFAIIRMGYRGSTYGTLSVDSCFYDNIKGAQAAGIDVGVYFYSQATSKDEAVEEAEYVLAAVSGYTLQCPIFFDWEEGTPRAERLNGVTMKDVADFSNAFCSRIEDAGYSAGVYFNQKYGYGMKLLGLQKYSFWLAEFSDYMSFGFDVQYWQYTYEGEVNGISTKVDLDLCYVSEDRNEENH